MIARIFLSTRLPEYEDVLESNVSDYENKINVIDFRRDLPMSEAPEKTH